MKGVGIVENLELLYSLQTDDAQSKSNLKDTLASLKKILDDNKDMKINVTGFESLSKDLTKVNSEA